MSKWVTPHPTIGATNDAFRLPSSRPQETSAPFSPVPIQGKLKYRSEKLKENKLRIKKPTIRHSGSKSFSTLPLSGKELRLIGNNFNEDEGSSLRTRDFNGASYTTLRLSSTIATSLSLASPFASRAPSPKKEGTPLDHTSSSRKIKVHRGNPNHSVGLEPSSLEPPGLRRRPSAPVPLRSIHEFGLRPNALTSSPLFNDCLAQSPLRIESGSAWLPTSGLGAVDFNRPPSRLSFFEELGFGWNDKELLDTSRPGAERLNCESPAFSLEGVAAAATPAPSPQSHSRRCGQENHPSRRTRSLSAIEGLDLAAVDLRHVVSGSKSEGDDVDMDLTSDIFPTAAALGSFPRSSGTSSPVVRSSSEGFSTWLDAPFTTWETDSLISPPTIYQKLARVIPNGDGRSEPNWPSDTSKESDNSLDWPLSRSSSDSDDAVDCQPVYSRTGQTSSAARRTRSGTIIGPQAPDPPGTRRTRSGTITMQSSIPQPGIVLTTTKRGRSGTIVSANSKSVATIIESSPRPQVESADSLSDLGDDEKEEGYQDSIYIPPSSDSPDEIDFLSYVDPFGWGDESGDEEFIDGVGHSNRPLKWCVPLDPPSPIVTRVKASTTNQRAIRKRDKAMLRMRALSRPRKRGRGSQIASVPIREQEDAIEEDELNCLDDDTNICMF